MSRSCWPLVVVLLASGGLSSGIAAAATAPVPPAASYPVEQSSSDMGNRQSVTSTVVADGDTSYRLWFPSVLGQRETLDQYDYRHSIVVWGNGNGSSPDDYAGLLQHFASWGFVVAAPTSGAVGDGADMVRALVYLTAQHRTPGSVFYNRLDTDRVAAAGHSRGAVGALNMANKTAGKVSTVMTVALPNPERIRSGEQFHLSQIRVPVLFFGAGTDDIATPASLRGYYQQAPAGAVLAVRTQAEHSSVQGDGDGFRGYLTAWLRYQLLGDATARGAFVGNPPELVRNEHWQDQATRLLR